MAKYLGVAEARNRLPRLLSEMDADSEEVVILRYNKPRAVLVAWERWEALQRAETQSVSEKHHPSGAVLPHARD